MKINATLNQLGGESWALYCLASLGRKAAFNDVVEVGDLAHLLETLEQRLEALHNTIHALEYSAEVKAIADIQKGGAV